MASSDTGKSAMNASGDRSCMRSAGMSSATIRIGSPVTSRSSPKASLAKNTARDNPSDGYRSVSKYRSNRW